MNLSSMSLPDLAGALLGFGFTVLVFSYIFGDNALFRLTLHIFIGVTAGYAAVVAWYNVLWPQLLLPLIMGSQSERLFTLIPLALSGLLLLKTSVRLTRLGNPALAFLVGVGMAAAIGGAVMGTLFPQTMAAINMFDLGAAPEGNWFEKIARGFLMLIGTLSTLIYFQFGARHGQSSVPQRSEWVESIAWIGQIFIAITLGALFAGVLSAGLTALIERIFSMGDLILPLFMPR